MIVGIVGSEAAKFTEQNEVRAKQIIRNLLSRPGVTAVCSGRCRLGGIDIWAEEIGAELGLSLQIYPPKTESWDKGYKPRNIQIARASTEVYCITVATLPPGYQGMRFTHCYHCNTDKHVKSGGCWTMKYATKLGKKTGLFVVGG